jgi:hypothetical protein
MAPCRVRHTTSYSSAPGRTLPTVGLPLPLWQGLAGRPSKPSAAGGINHPTGMIDLDRGAGSGPNR